MSEKSLINSVEDCVDECLYGFSKLHPNLRCYYREKIVLDPEVEEEHEEGEGKKRKTVGVISGGGSGHEPFPSGYVGKGMLTGSVSGSIFTSPPSSHVLSAIRVAAKGREGILVVVPNYTGDVLNFGLAAEIAMSEGIPIESLVVGEDIAQDIYGITNKTGRRGMCGLIFVFKIAGHLADAGEGLSSLRAAVEEAVGSMASLGLCVSPCSKPGVGLLFRLNPNELELGVGVHGEAGVARFNMMSAKEAVKIILDSLMQYLKISPGDEVAVMLNNLGSLTYLEQWLLAGEVEKQLLQQNVIVLRLYAGCFFTSLNMAGVQICILKINKKNKKLYLEALDHPTSAHGWPKAMSKQPGIDSIRESLDVLLEIPKCFSKSLFLPPEKAEILKQCLIQIGADLKKEERRLNDLDSVCGDGDCGTTFNRIASVILEKAQANVLNFSYPASLFFSLSLTMQESIGGTSGALYGLFFKGISNEAEEYTAFDGARIAAKCWRAGIDIIKKYSSARLGDRTMLDSLEKACEVFETEVEGKIEGTCRAFQKAVKAAEEACQSTKVMKAQAGRASYTDHTQQTDVDAGAFAVTVWLTAVLKVLETQEKNYREKSFQS